MTHIIEATLTEARQYKKVKYFLAYGADQELIQNFKKQVAEEIVLDEVVESILPSVIGAHVGSGVVALGYFILEK